jgi:probable rRNA maturation factor
MSLVVQCIEQSIAYPMPAKDQVERWVVSAWLDPDATCELSVINQSKEAIQLLNNNFRSHDKATNVLAFPMHELMDGTLYVGDVICCGAVIHEEARQQHKLLEHHWAHLIVHAVLHLQSFTHDDAKQAEVMETMEIRILHTLNIPNPY